MYRRARRMSVVTAQRIFSFRAILACMHAGIFSRDGEKGLSDRQHMCAPALRGVRRHIAVTGRRSTGRLSKLLDACWRPTWGRTPTTTRSANRRESRGQRQLGRIGVFVDVEIRRSTVVIGVWHVHTAPRRRKGLTRQDCKYL